MEEATEKERQWAEELNQEQLQKIREYAQKTGKLEIISLTPEQRKVWEKQLKSIYPKFYSTIGKDLIEKVEKAGEEAPTSKEGGK
jgi:C4-dicarboxylate-binding protein DctP